MQLLLVTQRCCSPGGGIIIENNLSLKTTRLSCQIPWFWHLLTYLLQEKKSKEGLLIPVLQSHAWVWKTRALPCILKVIPQPRKKKKRGLFLFFFFFYFRSAFHTVRPSGCICIASLVTKKQLTLGQNMATTQQHAASLWGECRAGQWPHANTRLIIIIRNKKCCWKACRNQNSVQKLGEVSIILNAFWPGQTSLRQYQTVQVIWTMKVG